MKGFATLSSLLEVAPKTVIAGRCDPAIVRAMEAFMRAPSFSYLAAGCERLRSILAGAQSEGREILMIGCAPSDVSVEGSHWSARAQIVLDGCASRMMVDLTGVTEPRARIVSARLIHSFEGNSNGRF